MGANEIKFAWVKLEKEKVSRILKSETILTTAVVSFKISWAANKSAAVNWWYKYIFSYLYIRFTKINKNGEIEHGANFEFDKIRHLISSSL